MLAHHKSELICDLAEYYCILDYRRVPCRLLGTLAVGLRAESRIGMLRESIKVDPETIMLARIHDILMQVFSSKGEKPEPILRSFIIEKKSDKDTPMAYKSPEAFKRAWADKMRE
jgi:hypothetical protein